MKHLYIPIILLLTHQKLFSQCTPALVRATATINTPVYTLNTAFNPNTTDPANINNLSSGLINFNGVRTGTARWTGGVQLQNDASVGNYIFVQPNLTTNPTTPTNTGTYTVNFTEPVTNLSFRCGGLNNQDRIVITAFNGATPIAIPLAAYTDNVADPGNAGVIVISGAGNNILTGNNTAGGVSVITNRITLNLTGPVTRIVMVTGKADNGTGNVTLGFTSFAYTKCAKVPPDVNATFVNVPVTGNVGTNDVRPTGTTYGTATALPGNPGPALPTINSDGTYSFTSAVTGVFKFTVPMCPGSVVIPDCPNVELVITVTDGAVYTNNPVANTDRATTPINTAVTLNTLANDKAGNNSTVALNPASVTVTTAPPNGTTIVNPATGAITYTPNPGFTGIDILTYQVCDLTSPTPLCATSTQVITVEPAGSANSTVAADDYNSTPLNKPVSGNVINNDSDPQTNTQTITAQNTTIPGKGTLVLNTNGTYTFTPVFGFTGPVNFPYEVCDNGSPVACTNATLYILVFSSFSLPLDLVSFDVTTLNTDSRLTWKSENQVNVSHFEIERSATNPVSYSVIGTVPVSAGLSGIYSFIDVNAKNYITKGFYRLKIVDIDGRFSYSPIRLVNFGNDLAISIRPTIVTAGQPIIVLTGASADQSVYNGSFHNQAGQLIKKWNAGIGSNQQIETTNLAKGIYILRIVHKEGVITEKIVIQ